jgi:cytidylate kinase
VASPLKPAANAILIDTTRLGPEEVVGRMEAEIHRKFKNSREISLA